MIFLSRLAEMSSAVIAGPSPGDDALILLRKALTDFSPSSAASFFGRAPRAATSFIDALTELVLASGHEAAQSGDRAAIVDLACGIVEEVFRAARRIVAQTHRPGQQRRSIRANPMAPVLAEVAGRFADVVEPISPQADEAISMLRTNLKTFIRQANLPPEGPMQRQPAGDA